MYEKSFGYKILLIEDNPGDAELIQEMLMEMDEIPFQVSHAHSLLEGLKHLSSSQRHDVILVDLYLADSQGLETFQTIYSHAKDTPVVVLTGVQCDSVGVEAVSRGAQDFLVKTGLNTDLLVRALRYAMVRGRREPTQNGKSSSSSHAIGFLGVKGGVGTTSVSCHFASQLNKQTEASVLCADLDLEGGALGFLLQASGAYSIADAIENLHRLDADYWKKVIAQGLGGVHVLKSPASVGRQQKPSAEVAACVLRFARNLYPWIVVDLGRHNDFAAQLAIELDEVILVSTTELVSLQAARKVKDLLIDNSFPAERLKLLLNRSTSLASSPQAIHDVVGLPVYQYLPESSRELSEAYIDGKLAAANSSFGRATNEFIRKATGLNDNRKESWSSQLKNLLLSQLAPKAAA